MATTIDKIERAKKEMGNARKPAPAPAPSQPVVLADPDGQRAEWVRGTSQLSATRLAYVTRGEHRRTPCGFVKI